MCRLLQTKVREHPMGKKWTKKVKAFFRYLVISIASLLIKYDHSCYTQKELTWSFRSFDIPKGFIEQLYIDIVHFK